MERNEFTLHLRWPYEKDQFISIVCSKETGEGESIQTRRDYAERRATRSKGKASLLLRMMTMPTRFFRHRRAIRWDAISGSVRSVHDSVYIRNLLGIIFWHLLGIRDVHPHWFRIRRCVVPKFLNLIQKLYFESFASSKLYQLYCDKFLTYIIYVENEFYVR